VNQSLQTIPTSSSNRNKYNNLSTEEEVDKFIQKISDEKKLYSRTYIEQCYTPLSQNEKQKFLEDMNQDSDKRLKVYSNLFNEIKSQINFISDNISKSKEPIMNKIIEESEVNDFSLEIQKKKKDKKKSNIIYSNKNLLEINQSNIINLTSNTLQDEPLILEEEKSLLLVPVMEYKSNILKDLDFLSNPKPYSYSVSLEKLPK
jgi:hypothetical protein